MIYKARASQVGKLMTPPKSKKAKEAGELGETAKSYLDEVAIEKIYGRSKPLRTDELRKGEECEEAAITMLMRQLGEWTEKNGSNYKDEHFSGTPDVIVGNTVYDTKVPFDIWTFHKAEPPILDTGKKTLYYWQLQVYMALTGCTQGQLVYCLVDTPETMLEDKIHRAKFQYEGGDEDPGFEVHQKQLIAAHRYNDIDESERVKMYPVERSEEDIEAMKEKVEQAREYLKDWKL